MSREKMIAFIIRMLNAADDRLIRSVYTFLINAL